jgi:hypothetical protein
MGRGAGSGRLQFWIKRVRWPQQRHLRPWSDILEVLRVFSLILQVFFMTQEDLLIPL